MLHFIANLKPYTLDLRPRGRWFSGYLLSTDYYSPLRGLVSRVLEWRRLLVADNGNVDRIGALISEFQAEAATLDTARRAEEATLRRYARPGELSAALTGRFAELAARVSARCRDLTSVEHVRDVLRIQTAMTPTYSIGMEDFSISVLTGCGIEPEYSRLPLEYYEDKASRALDFALRTRAGEFGPCPSPVFAGMHAMDLDTAQAVGRAAGGAGADGIAAGLGAALDDRSYVDFRVAGGLVRELGAAVPRPYMRTAEIVAGLQLGFTGVTGRRPRMHVLGVGAPIMIVLLGALTRRRTFFAIDSTAPIKDAWSSKTISLYVDRPAPLKLKAHVIAQRWLEGSPGWSCRCTGCARFLSMHPFDLRRARAWWISEGRRNVEWKDLWAPGPLAEALPLLGMPAEPSTRRAAGMARVEHNHRAVLRLQSAIRGIGTGIGFARTRAGQRSADAALMEHVAGCVDAYERSAGDPSWARATREAWGIVKTAAQDLASAEDGGEWSDRRPGKWFTRL